MGQRTRGGEGKVGGNEETGKIGMGGGKGIKKGDKKLCSLPHAAPSPAVISKVDAYATMFSDNNNGNVTKLT